MKRQTSTPSPSPVNLPASIYAVGQQLNRKDLLIEEIGDYIPGSVMIQDLNTMTNNYMNKQGCEILRHSKEELLELGPRYFEKFFPAEEIAFLAPILTKFIADRDYNKVYSFFQRVRPNESAEYRWYLTTSRLCPAKDPNSLPTLMHIAVEVNGLNVAGRAMNGICSDHSYVLQHYRKFNLLSKREKEIISYIAMGMSSYEISDRLFISIHTVNNHRKNILNKLGMVSLAQLVRFAVAFGLLE
ncbi:response regulator transcription factor [Pedobacter sp. SYSU D00535]|uniref:response regulator transcription factor n=1 Tax=Pedobacter sp. SYSU D00535 TaxID=2810308 RepID=UPI001A964E30|nr:helix-turn-helix transcriptional regulator [Pedobacter sp. SYSU D00535]